MGQITATRNLIATKVVRLAGQKKLDDGHHIYKNVTDMQNLNTSHNKIHVQYHRFGASVYKCVQLLSSNNVLMNIIFLHCAMILYCHSFFGTLLC